MEMQFASQKTTRPAWQSGACAPDIPDFDGGNHQGKQHSFRLAWGVADMQFDNWLWSFYRVVQFAKLSYRSITPPNIHQGDLFKFTLHFPKQKAPYRALPFDGVFEVRYVMTSSVHRGQRRKLLVCRVPGTATLFLMPISLENPGIEVTGRGSAAPVANEMHIIRQMLGTYSPSTYEEKVSNVLAECVPRLAEGVVISLLDVVPARWEGTHPKSHHPTTTNLSTPPPLRNTAPAALRRWQSGGELPEDVPEKVRGVAGGS